MILLLDGQHGIYIPQLFAQNYPEVITNMDEVKDDFETIKRGPDDEYYWEAWDNVLNNAKVKDVKGNPGTLYQDDDLWFIDDTDEGPGADDDSPVNPDETYHIDQP
jgi:hypothetical protein